MVVGCCCCFCCLLFVNNTRSFENAINRWTTTWLNDAYVDEPKCRNMYDEKTEMENHDNHWNANREHWTKNIANKFLGCYLVGPKRFFNDRNRNSICERQTHLWNMKEKRSWCMNVLGRKRDWNRSRLRWNNIITWKQTESAFLFISNIGHKINSYLIWSNEKAVN